MCGFFGVFFLSVTSGTLQVTLLDLPEKPGELLSTSCFCVVSTNYSLCCQSVACDFSWPTRKARGVAEHFLLCVVSTNYSLCCQSVACDFSWPTRKARGVAEHFLLCVVSTNYSLCYQSVAKAFLLTYPKCQDLLTVPYLVCLISSNYSLCYLLQVPLFLDLPENQGSCWALLLRVVSTTYRLCYLLQVTFSWPTRDIGKCWASTNATRDEQTKNSIFATTGIRFCLTTNLCSSSKHTDFNTTTSQQRLAPKSNRGKTKTNKKTLKSQIILLSVNWYFEE